MNIFSFYEETLSKLEEIKKTVSQTQKTINEYSTIVSCLKKTVNEMYLWAQSTPLPREAYKYIEKMSWYKLEKRDRENIEILFFSTQVICNPEERYYGYLDENNKFDLDYPLFSPNYSAFYELTAYDVGMVLCVDNPKKIKIYFKLDFDFVSTDEDDMNSDEQIHIKRIIMKLFKKTFPNCQVNVLQDDFYNDIIRIEIDDWKLFEV